MCLFYVYTVTCESNQLILVSFLMILLAALAIYTKSIFIFTVKIPIQYKSFIISCLALQVAPEFHSGSFTLCQFLTGLNGFHLFFLMENLPI